MNKSYRIKANVGKDQVLNVSLKQDVDLYDVLSLQLKVNNGKDNVYKLHSSDYGVIVGRVLANDAFGVPNAKVSVFIPLSDEDSLISSIKMIYPYKFVTDYNSKNVKYNTLPNYNENDDCYRAVGSFPKKRLVLDNDSVLDVYDKYYKYTTKTNKSGDYMIFGVPVGEQMIHIDVDLSDIGILSQKPRDFIYKGYSIDMFESPTQFKKSTDLDSLAQIHNESVSVTVYPFWGDKDSNEIAITRKDINLQYKFETTCVFLGSVMTDDETNSISHNCIPDANMGEAGQLVPSEGTIEMIRKTIDGTIEQYSIKGNQLIDGDGVWCYQIPMNLDYVGTDEYGNICPTDNPSKGIPTRARVRFRLTLNESSYDSMTKHKARVLVPNNPDLYQGSLIPRVSTDIIDEDMYYEFGTLTPDECFRDLYWDKVYSVKSYIPRLQVHKHEQINNYLAIKGVNKKDARKNNPIPFNKMNLNFTIPAYKILDSIGNEDGKVGLFWRFLRSNAVRYSTDAVREQVLEEMDAVGLDFYNDWLNGCIYFPLWFWRVREKKKYKKGESVYDSNFCECKNVNDENQEPLYLFNNCSLVYSNEEFSMLDETNLNDPTKGMYVPFNDMFNVINFGTKQFFSGIIKNKKNKDDADVFYYSFGNKISNDKFEGDSDYDNALPEEYRPSSSTRYYNYVRLFSTDIILLGSLNECDVNGVPTTSYNLPSTTANIPYVGRYKHDEDGSQENKPIYNTNDQNENVISYNGMNWGSYWKDIEDVDLNNLPTGYKYLFNTGLLFGLYYQRVPKPFWTIQRFLNRLGLGLLIKSYFPPIFGKEDVVIAHTKEKSCINAERMCELGVTQDTTYVFKREYRNKTYTLTSEMDGLITKREIEDVESRALFSTLNTNKLNGVIENSTTGYKTYNLTYCYPTNFDGRLEYIASAYTEGITEDDRNPDYISFRLGTTSGSTIVSVNTNGSKNGERSPGGHAGHRRASSTEEYDINNNGSVSYVSYEMPRRPHFYGYDTDKDSVYPLYLNKELFKEIFSEKGLLENNRYVKYAFPLYENSFYFYFGLNIGSTAIDKFYNQFYTRCVSDKNSRFIISISFTAATACDDNAKIEVAVENIDMPYSIEVYNSAGELIRKLGGVKENTSTITELSNGKYLVRIIDAYGDSMEENINIKYNPIELNTTILSSIKSDNPTSNDQCGVLELNSVVLYGENINITNILCTSDIEEDCRKYRILNNRVKISLENPRNLDGSVYEGEFVFGNDGQNKLYISNPIMFDIKAQELCNGNESDNISYTYVIMEKYSMKIDTDVNYENSEIEFKMLTLYGKTYDITGITNSDSTYTIEAENLNYTVTMTLTPSDVTLGDIFENKIEFTGGPGTINIEVRESSLGGHSESTITINS